MYPFVGSGLRDAALMNAMAIWPRRWGSFGGWSGLRFPVFRIANLRLRYRWSLRRAAQQLVQGRLLFALNQSETEKHTCRDVNCGNHI